MKVIATWPKEPRTKDSAVAATGLAFVLLIMAVLELFRLDNFILLLDDFQLPAVSGRAAAMFLTILAVMALPFLLRMKLSPGFRWFSMLSGWLVIAGWLFIAVWLNLVETGATNLGLLGSEIDLVPGVWAIFFVLALAVLAAWAAWGLWPAKQPVVTKPAGETSHKSVTSKTAKPKALKPSKKQKTPKK